MLLLFAAFWPMLAAPAAWLLGRRKPRAALLAMAGASAVELAALAVLFVLAARGEAPQAAFACVFPARLAAGGFQALYALVAGVMWLGTSAFSLDYFKHEHSVGRYCFFTLVTLGATVGVMLSDSLYTTFLFFEIMSLCSYPWVAHEETPEAMRAAETYLYIAIIGGLCMLMGLLLLPQGLTGCAYAELQARASGAQADLWPAALLLLIGFGAKAGAFPLHVWLPKAHPVAPAPASALLSGILTKSGVFGALVLTVKLMAAVRGWGALVFWLGVITMVLGAVLALFSVNLKRTLACSSLSQIGFILVGVGLCGLLGHENGLAAWGTVQHMVNHSLFKLILFLCAGVVAMQAHALSLNDIRGFGRGKPVLHIAFLSGMLGIAGVPGFSGYISKSLLHEGILEYQQLLALSGQSAVPYTVAEWLFLVSGGMTLAYMLKLYLCLFWRKHPARQTEFDALRVPPVSAAVLGCCAALPPLLGLLPDVLMSGLARLSQPFLQTEGPAAVAYFSLENLKGAAISLGLGALTYLCVVRPLLTRREGEPYPNRWPARLDMENSLYRPLLAGLAAVGGALCRVLDHLTDWATAALRLGGAATARLLEKPVDAAVTAVSETVLAPSHPSPPPIVGNRLTQTLGRALDAGARLLNRTVRKRRPIRTRFEYALAAGQEELNRQTKRLTRSVSYGLLLFCLGLFGTLVYLLAA